MDTKKISVMPVDAKTFADRQDVKLRRVNSVPLQGYRYSSGKVVRQSVVELA